MVKARLQIHVSIFKLTRNEACIRLVVPVDVSNSSPSSRIIYIVPKFYLFLMIRWLLLIKKMSYTYVIILLKEKLCIKKNELNFHFVDTPKRPWRSFSQMQWSIMQGPIYWRGTPWGTSQYLLRFVSLC